MVPVKERWTEERGSPLDDVELHLPEEQEAVDQPRVPIYHKRRGVVLWTALAFLVAALAVLAIYGYSVVGKQNTRLAWLPGLTKSIAAVRARTDALESRLKDWSSRQRNLAARVQKLDAKWEARLHGVRRYAAELVGNAYEKEHEELNQRTSLLRTQMDEMESRQQADHTHLTQVEKEMAATRQEVATVRDSHSRELATLQRRQSSTQGEIDSINNLLSTDQVNFEADKGHDTEIVRGISLHLTGTNISHQRFRGWIWLAAARRRLWFRRQTVEAPVVFYPKSGGEAYELVVTRVDRKDVTGYLLIPSESESQSQRANTASNSRAPGGAM